jgi:hypothetical protein
VSDLMAIRLAAAVPAADLIGRALNEQRKNARDARASAFFFLHALSEDAAVLAQ